MSHLRRAAILGVGATLSLLILGFVLFASVVTRTPAPPAELKADGIVVLTGEGNRIAEGARLLQEGHAERMLISGVFRRTGKKALIEISGLGEDTFDCCVDVGYAALDTAGNAHETRDWAAARGYETLIVVTASYHMPRSLAELSLALPNTKLIPHPVVPNSFPPNRWWLNTAVTRTLISEYFKFLPTVAHVTVARLLRSAPASSMAGVSSSSTGQPAGI